MHPSAIHAAILGTGAGNLVLKLGQGRRTRGSRSPESAPLKDFGGKLYGAVFQDKLRDALQRGLTLTHAQQAGMRLADNPELAELPWEFPYDLRRAGSCPIAPRRSYRTAEGLSEILRHYL
jgi:hypothetical protein